MNTGRPVRCIITVWASMYSAPCAGQTLPGTTVIPWSDTFDGLCSSITSATPSSLNGPESVSRITFSGVSAIAIEATVSSMIINRCSMKINRRRLIRIAAAAAAAKGGQSAEPTAGRMKVGTQHSTTDDVLKVLAAFGVNNICSTLPSPKFDENWSVDGLKRLRERVESFGTKLECVPLPLSSAYIAKSENPGIMLGKSPQRDREIDDID